MLDSCLTSLPAALHTGGVALAQHTFPVAPAGALGAACVCLMAGVLPTCPRATCPRAARSCRVPSTPPMPRLRARRHAVPDLLRAGLPQARLVKVLRVRPHWDWSEVISLAAWLQALLCIRKLRSPRAVAAACHVCAATLGHAVRLVSRAAACCVPHAAAGAAGRRGVRMLRRRAGACRARRRCGRAPHAPPLSGAGRASPAPRVMHRDWGPSSPL